jgi:hypothetical protein
VQDTPSPSAMTQAVVATSRKRITLTTAVGKAAFGPDDFAVTHCIDNNGSRRLGARAILRRSSKDALRGEGSTGRVDSRSRGSQFASVSVALSEQLQRRTSAVASAASSAAPKVDTKPASDVLAGALARAVSQSTIHPLDTFKVSVQAASMWLQSCGCNRILGTVVWQTSVCDETLLAAAGDSKVNRVWHCWPVAYTCTATFPGMQVVQSFK